MSLAHDDVRDSDPPPPAREDNRELFRQVGWPVLFCFLVVTVSLFFVLFAYGPH